MSKPSSESLWSSADRTRHFVVPDEVKLTPGDFPIRTATGTERMVDEGALEPYEVTEAEAQAWAKEQLGDVLGEIRGKAVGFAERLKARTAEMREENRKTWEEGVAGAPPDLREAAATVRSGLRDFGRALQRIARENIERAEAERATSDERAEETAPKKTHPGEASTGETPPDESEKTS